MPAPTPPLSAASVAALVQSLGIGLLPTVSGLNYLVCPKDRSNFGAQVNAAIALAKSQGCSELILSDGAAFTAEVPINLPSYFTLRAAGTTDGIHSAVAPYIVGAKIYQSTAGGISAIQAVGVDAGNSTAQMISRACLRNVHVIAQPKVGNLPNTAYAVNFSNCYRPEIEHVYITGALSGHLYLSNCWDYRVTDFASTGGGYCDITVAASTTLEVALGRSLGTPAVQVVSPNVSGFGGTDADNNGYWSGCRFESSPFNAPLFVISGNNGVMHMFSMCKWEGDETSAPVFAAEYQTGLNFFGCWFMGQGTGSYGVALGGCAAGTTFKSLVTSNPGIVVVKGCHHPTFLGCVFNYGVATGYTPLDYFVRAIACDDVDLQHSMIQSGLSALTTANGGGAWVGLLGGTYMDKALPSCLPYAVTIAGAVLTRAITTGTTSAGRPRFVGMEVVSASSYTLSLADAGKRLFFTAACAVTVTDLGIGFEVVLEQGGSGQVSVLGPQGTALTSNLSSGGFATTQLGSTLRVSCKGTGTVNVESALPGLSLATQLNATSITSSGTVSAITSGNGASGNGIYYLQPTVSIAAPPAGGVQATGQVYRMARNSQTVVTGGSGYSVGQVLTAVGGTLTPGNTAAACVVASVDSNGAVLTVTSTASSGYLVLPNQPCATTVAAGSSNPASTAGSGCTLQIAFKVVTYQVLNGGSGYLTAPAVTVSPGSDGTSATLATAVATISNTVTLGAPGASGSPVAVAGNFLRADYAVALTGTTISVPDGYSSLLCTQTATVSAQTLGLTAPTAARDGVMLDIFSMGAITALTFSPAVTGWTNGNTLAANTPLRIKTRGQLSTPAWTLA